LCGLLGSQATVLVSNNTASATPVPSNSAASASKFNWAHFKIPEDTFSVALH